LHSAYIARIIHGCCDVIVGSSGITQQHHKRRRILNLGTIWKSDWWIGATLTLLIIMAWQQQFPALQYFQSTLYDASAAHLLQPDHDRIVIINIDQNSRHQSGLQAHQAMAAAIDQLTNANARLIGIDSMFTTPPPSSVLDNIRKSGNTLLAMDFNIGTGQTPTNITLPSHLQAMALKHVNPAYDYAKPVAALSINHPDQQLTRATAGTGHINSNKDSDGKIRSETLAIAYGQHYFPSLTLMLAAKALNISRDDIRINIGKDIEVGSLTITTNAQLGILPTFFQTSEGVPFPTYSFDQLHSGEIPNTVFNNNIILIGDAGLRPDNTFSTPSNPAMTHIEFSAHVLQSILDHRMVQRPAWTQAIELALLLITGLYLICLLPRLSHRLSIIISSLICITFIATEFSLLTYYAFWLPTISAAMLLLLGQILILCKHTFMPANRQKKSTRDIHQTNKMLGVSFQKQGMLDQAFEKFMACPVDDDMLSVFYKLALAFERKKQFKQATAVYEYIASHKPAYMDIQTRIMAATGAEETLANEDPNAVLSTLLISGEHKPTLGRYEIISELGKGAMGTVYLGQDPKINRQVAIKTMALSQEFEVEELEEVKAKFFHEAEIAGMLNHPNIVTIFDAGDERDLAYIAMEFLDGIDLSPYTKKDKLLPLSTTLKITAKVAEALQYAHDNGVIHRDIKPANIMILKNKSVKVTDFGIAHIIDCSKVKAGVVLGTPSYMSPEQLSGKTLDGRSDLFSLGVMLYELISGTRPFRAESISKLMYKIAKQPHVDVREHHADVPESVYLLINELLAKKADQRIATAKEVQIRLSACLREMKSNGEDQ